MVRSSVEREGEREARGGERESERKVEKRNQSEQKWNRSEKKEISPNISTRSEHMEIGQNKNRSE